MKEYDKGIHNAPVFKGEILAINKEKKVNFSSMLPIDLNTI
jgi:hypothetical protein